MPVGFFIVDALSVEQSGFDIPVPKGDEVAIVKEVVKGISQELFVAVVLVIHYIVAEWHWLVFYHFISPYISVRD